MPEPQTDTTADKTVEKARDAQRAGKTAEAVEAERRTFEANGPQEAARAGFDTARDVARRGAEATRQIAESGRRTTSEIADLWRDAINPMLKSQLELSRWFDQAWRQTTGLGALPTLHAARPFAGFGAAPLFGLPPADMKETATAYELSVELPGMGREDIDLRIRDDLLTLRGCKVEESESAQAAYRVSERRFGRFERSFPIPADARRDGLQAAFADGVLKITLPKAEGGVENPGQRVDIR